jgi:solute carrier family 10 (sodium/bile acid cotransporter), member 7
VAIITNMAAEAKKEKPIINTIDLEKGSHTRQQNSQDEISIDTTPEEPQAQPTQPKEPEKKKNIIVRLLLFMKEQWFLLTLAILIAIASQHQVPKDQQHIKSIVVSYVCVSVIFFLTGCTLSTKVLIDNYSRIKLHLWVQIQCFFLTSAVMFAVVSAAATNRDFMDPGLLVGMILTGCVATTISSNVVMTGQAHGNKALTVVESTIGNFLGPFLTPALFKAYTSTGAWYNSVLPPEPGGYQELYRRVFKQLGLSVFIPMVSEKVTFYQIQS